MADVLIFGQDILVNVMEIIQESTALSVSIFHFSARCLEMYLRLLARRPLILLTLGCT